MEFIVIALLVIFVPLIMVVVGLSLFNKSTDSIAQTRREMKNTKMENFADDFFSLHGMDAPWELYISEFQKKYGRKPLLAEIKVPRVKANDVEELLKVCREQGIS
jgi:hypothetical protein